VRGPPPAEFAPTHSSLMSVADAQLLADEVKAEARRIVASGAIGNRAKANQPSAIPASPSQDIGFLDPSFDWLPERFASLVDAARQRWVGLDEAVDFLATGAVRAVDTIYETVGLVGPPVCPEAGSVFLVDERRLAAWRDDGYAYGARTAGGGGAGVASRDIAFILGSDGSVGAQQQQQQQQQQASVVLEWGRVTGFTAAAAVAGDAQPPRQLQRRAIRLPRMATLTAEALFSRLAPPQLACAATARERALASFGWVWLLQYLDDPHAPLYDATGCAVALGRRAVRPPPSDAPSSPLPEPPQAIAAPVRGPPGLSEILNALEEAAAASNGVAAAAPRPIGSSPAAGLLVTPTACSPLRVARGS